MACQLLARLPQPQQARRRKGKLSVVNRAIIVTRRKSGRSERDWGGEVAPEHASQLQVRFRPVATDGNHSPVSTAGANCWGDGFIGGPIAKRLLETGGPVVLTVSNSASGEVCPSGPKGMGFILGTGCVSGPGMVGDGESWNKVPGG